MEKFMTKIDKFYKKILSQKVKKFIYVLKSIS